MAASATPRCSGPRVLYLIDSLAAGGAERSLVEVAPHLVSSGVRLSVGVLLDVDGLAPELEAAGVRVHRVGGSSRPQRLRRTSELLRSQRPDLLHTTLFESDVIGRVAALLTRIPTVCTLATTPYGPEHAKESGVRTSRLRAAQTADMVTARFVRRFHAVSHPVAEACIRRLRIDPQRVEVIPRGRDTRRMGAPTPERRLAVRRALGVEPSAQVLLFAGRQEPAKGLDVLINALPRVVEKQPGAVLLVAGRDGRSTSQVLQLIADRNLAGRVRVLGQRSDVPDLLCAADLFLLPSRREGLPGAVLEAMALHVPVVASDLPTVREAVPDETFAHLVPPGDPSKLAETILFALTNPDHTRSMADKSAVRFAQCFDIESVAESMIDFYGRALRVAI